MKKVSFVIPIYNVENYLVECVTSIVNQSGNNVEVLLIDDGSKDSSGKIADELEKKYKIVKAFHKENGGLASARNYGMKRATGEYIAFVDSDDLLYNNCINEIIEYLNKNEVDILFLEMDKFYPDGKKESMGDFIESAYLKDVDDISIVKYLSTRPKFPGSVCSKIYRLDFLKKNDIHFPYENRVSEDLGFTRDCLMLGKKMDKMSIPYYLYRQDRIGSITNMLKYKSFVGVSKFISESVDKYTKNNKPNSIKEKYALSFVAYEYAIMVYMYSRIEDNKNEMLSFLKKYKWIMKYSNEKKLKIISFMLFLFGIKISSKIIGLIKSHY